MLGVDRRAGGGSREPCSLRWACSGAGDKPAEGSGAGVWDATPHEQAGKMKDEQVKREWERRFRVVMAINIGTRAGKTCIFHVTPRKPFQPFTVTTAQRWATMA